MATMNAVLDMAVAASLPDPALEARIADAFEDQATSAEVRKLIPEVETAAKAAAAAAAEARERALNPLLTGDDLKCARREMEDANFTHDRMLEAGKKIALRAEELKAAEAEALLWEQHDRLTGERARLAEAMGSMADAIVQIAHIASQAAACDREIGQLNAKARGVIPHINMVLSGSAPPIQALFAEFLIWDTCAEIARRWKPSPKPEAATKG
jgi:hypothetical protein